jgi:hypothetical protein
VVALLFRYKKIHKVYMDRGAVSTCSTRRRSMTWASRGPNCVHQLCHSMGRPWDGSTPNRVDQSARHVRDAAKLSHINPQL